MLMSSLNTPTSNVPDSTGRTFPTSYSSQSAIAPGFHHTGSIQGLHNVHGNFSIPNMSGTLTSRNTTLVGVTSSGIQQPGGTISSGRFSSNNLSAAAISQLAHGNTITNRGSINAVGGSAFSSSMGGIGGSIPGINSSSGVISNRNSIANLGASPILGSTGPRITGSMGNIVGVNMGRNISSSGLTIPGLVARSNLSGSSSNSLNIQGTNRLKGGVLQQAPQMLGMLGNSYTNSGGPLSHGGSNQLGSMASSASISIQIHQQPKTNVFEFNSCSITRHNSQIVAASKPNCRLSLHSSSPRKIQPIRSTYRPQACLESHEEEQESLDAAPPLKIAILGFGNFGQFIAKGIQRQGHIVLATSRSDYSDYCRDNGVLFFRSVEEMCEQRPDVILICSSILSMESIVRAIPIHKLAPDTMFADVLSVKQFPRNLFMEVLSSEFGIVCTHPMFGPESGKGGWGKLPFVYDKVRISNAVQERKCNQFLSIFEKEDCEMVEMSCEEHDRHAAGSQFITHTIGRILSHLDIESTPINTKGYETLLELTENTVSDSFDLYYGLFMYNMNASEQIENLDRAFETVKQKLFGRLHDMLRKQIVERVPMNSKENKELVSGENSKHGGPLFLPNSQDMSNLSSFSALAPPKSPEKQPSQAQREEDDDRVHTTGI